MLTLENPTGRLLAIRASSPLSPEDVEHFLPVFKAPRPESVAQWICLIDLRGLRLVPPWAQARAADLLRAAPASMARTAFLVGADNAILLMQIERLVQGSGVSGFRAFDDRGAAARWLREALSSAESAAVDQFLERTRPPSRPPSFGVGLL